MHNTSSNAQDNLLWLAYSDIERKNGCALNHKDLDYVVADWLKESPSVWHTPFPLPAEKVWVRYSSVEASRIVYRGPMQHCISKACKWLQKRFQADALTLWYTYSAGEQEHRLIRAKK